MHLSKEALDCLVIAAAAAAGASPEIDMEPCLAPESHAALLQGLHNIELATRVPGIVVGESVEDLGNFEDVAVPFRERRRTGTRSVLVTWLRDAVTPAGFVLQP